MLVVGWAMPLETALETKSIAPGLRVERFASESRADSHDGNGSVRFRATYFWGKPWGLRPLFSEAFALLALWIAFWGTFEAGPAWLPELGRILIGAMGAVAFYVGVTESLNKTVVALDDRELTIRHVPLPWPSSRRLPLAAIVATRTASLGGVEPLYSVDIVTETTSYHAIPRFVSREAAEHVCALLDAELSNLKSELGANAAV